jgi:uncharacterized repeat protein (TIGR03803 family)
VVYSFCVLDKCADGGRPNSVILGAGGKLYGTTTDGGSHDDGVVYELDLNSQEIVLHSFTGGSDGSEPTDLTLGRAGNLYGTAVGGGDTNCFPPDGCGVVFKLIP